MSRKAKFRLLLLLVLLGVTGFLGYTVLRERNPLPPYLTAQKYYDEGLEREKASDFKGAAQSYDQACVNLEHAFMRLNGRHGLDEESLKGIAWKVLYLKARALRDKHYALAAAAGTPLPLTMDTVTGEKYRNVLAIREPAERDEAVGSLRGAATLFPVNDFDVQFDGLRLALVTTPIEWNLVERHSKAILALQPENSRAKYYLAKIEFEQPDLRTNLPTPPAKRSRERVKQAGRLIEEVGADPQFPVWRTEHLRASVLYWLVKNATSPREKRTSADREALDRLLFDDKQGALVRIGQRKQMEHLGVFDSEGIFGLYGIASEFALSKTRRDPGDPKSGSDKRDELALVQSVFEQTLDFCTEKVSRQDAAFPTWMISNTLLKTMVSGQAVLSVQDRKKWQDGLSLIKTCMKEEFASDRCDPVRVAQFAELLMREAIIVARRDSDAGRADEIRGEAKHWLSEGFAYGKRHNLTPVQMMPLHLLAANVGFLSGDSRREVAPHLVALARTGMPQATATSLLIDGGYDEREGRLLKAKEKVEKAVKIDGGDEEIRGHSMLASIYMAMNRPDYAIINLAYLKKVVDNYDDLTNLEREWWAFFIGTPLNFDALTVIVHLENARRNIALFHARNLDAKTYPPAIVKADEDRVKELMKELGSTGPGFIAQTAWIHHLSVTNRRQEAEDQWQALNVASPDRIEVLTLKIGLMEREAAESGDGQKKQSLIADVDKQIQAFMKANPTNASAAVFQAIWLAQTRRTDQSMAVLKNIVDSRPITPELRRVATAIMLTAQTETSPIALARHLPRNPQIDQVLLDLNRKSGIPRSEIKNAFVRHESVGLERIMQADDLYLAGSYAKAAELFAATLDFTRVRAFAQQGFLRSVFTFANQDAAGALATVERIIEEHPSEPAASLALAYVLLVQDKIGAPGDDPDVKKTMGGALVSWERKVTKMAADKGEDPIASPLSVTNISLTKSEFWLRANRVDLALDQAKYALKQEPNNPAALAACVAIILDDPSRDPRPELAGYLEALEKAAPESLPVQRLLGRAAEASQKWDEVVRIYEDVIGKSPYDRESYAHLVSAHEAKNSPESALKVIRAWREKMPNDSQAVAAEIRVLSRSKQVPRAIAAADQYLKQTKDIGSKRAEDLKDPAAKARLIEDSRWLPEIELARGFCFGGALDEAERRLLQLPKLYQESPVAQELLIDVHLKNKQWKKAEMVLETAVQKNPRNLTALNNLAYVLAVHGKNPARARTLILSALKSPDSAIGVRATDRLPAQFLHTIGVVYTTLADPQYGRELLQFFGTAAARFPNDPRVELYSGYGCELIGENARAREHYERAIKKADHPALTSEERVSLLADAAAFRDRVDRKLQSSKK